MATNELSDDSISAGCTSHLAAPLSYHLHLLYVLISTNWLSELIRFYKSCKYCMIHLFYCLQSCEDAGGEEKGVFLGNKEPLFALLSLPVLVLQVMSYAKHGCPFISLHSISFAAASGRVCVVWNFPGFYARTFAIAGLLLEYVSSKSQLIKSH